MSSPTPLPLLRIRYYEAAQEYLKSLPPEHFMEGRTQATQREITLASMALVRIRRPDIQCFNELLVQYPLRRRKKPGQVVPDNMVVVHDEEIEVEGSYDVPWQPVPPFWMLEYVSKSSKRKDYEDNREKYEKELKVPYYLLFVPESEEMVLFHHNGTRYVTVVPNEQGRVSIPELELELGLLDGWVRFWFRGELLPLPGDLLLQMDQLKREMDRLKRENDQLTGQVDQLKQDLTQSQQRASQLEAELARLRAQLPKPSSTEG